jgi:folylpolyglutamate synthase/dihydropteroate synthase
LSRLDACQQAVSERVTMLKQVLVTGSLYIVGDMLRHLGKAPGDS